MAESVNEKLNQYLAFGLDGESYGVTIGSVREVISQARITAVPTTPGFVRGVINLRGTIVPVLDLKNKFGIGDTGKDKDTCIVIVSVKTAAEDTVVGFLADRLEEVFDLDTDLIEPPPKYGTRIDTDFISGMGKRGEGFTMLLDVDRVFCDRNREGFFTGQIA